MAGHVLRILCAFALTLPILHAQAEDEPAPARPAPEKLREIGPPHPRLEKFRDGGPDALRMERNRERWESMSPERREAMRRAARERIEQVQAELRTLIEQAGGDKLDPERRRKIEARYFEERRKLEGRLRREMDEKRKQEIPEILDAIKAEFGIE